MKVWRVNSAVLGRVIKQLASCSLWAHDSDCWQGGDEWNHFWPNIMCSVSLIFIIQWNCMLYLIVLRTHFQDRDSGFSLWIALYVGVPNVRCWNLEKPLWQVDIYLRLYLSRQVIFRMLTSSVPNAYYSWYSLHISRKTVSVFATWLLKRSTWE